MNEKKKALIHKLVLLGISLAVICWGCIEFYETATGSISILFMGFLLFLIFLYACFAISYKEIEYNGKTISTYSGYFHHTLRVDGELCDEETSGGSWVPIKLSTVLDGKDLIEVKMTMCTTIKINGKIYK